jgi:hypothetical protein
MPERAVHLIRLGRLSGVMCALLSLALVPVSVIERGPGVCIFKHLFGRECLGCGLTRGLSALLHGNLAVALSYNRLVLVVFTALCLLLFLDVLSVARSVLRERRARASAGLVGVRAHA